MEEPHAIVTREIELPADEIEEVIAGALTSVGFRSNFNYIETRNEIQTEREIIDRWNGQVDAEKLQVEIQWRLQTTGSGADHSQSLKVLPAAITIRAKSGEHKEQQDLAKEKIDSIWKEITKRAIEAVARAPYRRPRSDYGNAQYAESSDLIAEDYVSEKNEEPDTRLLLGKLDGHTISVPKQFTEAHAIVCGPPGSGKSRCIFIPNLVNRPGSSAIVTEVSSGDDQVPTVWSLTAGYRKSHGHKIYYFNPADPNNSVRFNPIDFISDIDDARYQAHLIIANTKKPGHVGGDQIWVQTETSLLTALLIYAWGLGGKKKSVAGGLSNLGHIRRLLRLGPIKLRDHIKKFGINEARERMEEFINNSSPNFRYGVCSGLIARLDTWTSPTIVQLTEVTDFTEEELQESLFTFYLAFPVHREEFKPMMALALNFMTRLPLKCKFAKPMTFLFDELAAYGTIPGIGNIQAVVRNREVGMVFGFQQFGQLCQNYSEREAQYLFDNSDTKVIFATSSPEMQTRVSQQLSQMTVVRKVISNNGTVDYKMHGKPLMEPGQVGRIEKDRVLIMRNGRNPVVIERFNPGKYEHLKSEYPAPKLPPRVTSNQLQQQCEEAKLPPDWQPLADQVIKDVERLSKQPEYIHWEQMILQFDAQLKKVEASKEKAPEESERLMKSLNQAKKGLEEYVKLQTSNSKSTDQATENESNQDGYQYDGSDEDTYDYAVEDKRD